MSDLLALLPAFPLAGFVILALAGARLPRRAVSWIGVGSVGVSAVFAFLLALRPGGGSLTQVLWTWVPLGDMGARIAFLLDPLSTVMILIITGVGFLIHLYSVGFMADDEARSRFFAYMNLFVGSMLILVLADNLLLLYLGWEGVGLCSYLLIGFWYRDPSNGAAARKAFLVTRVGDTAMILGIFLVLGGVGSLHIPTVLARAPGVWALGSGTAVLVAALLLGGAVGKSAQLPLQTWLPDAMAGPTPVSALIHAATMVTAGVYLIARVHPLFELAPPVMTTVAWIGAATLLLAGFSALGQRDLKRVLAYSTISQLGYMFLALGVGAWSAAIFHLMTHAFFKALLFLGAGAVLHACHHEHDMFKLGGLRRELPVTFWTFLIAASALAGLPLVTAGFYSKDRILSEAFVSGGAGPVLWLAGLVGALLTALYIFRAVLVTFTGDVRTHVERRPGLSMTIPLVVLAVFSLVGGFVETPSVLGGLHLFGDYLRPVLPSGPEVGLGLEVLLLAAAVAAFLGGLLLAWASFAPGRRAAGEAEERVRGVPAGLQRFWAEGFRFDDLYHVLFVRPVTSFATWNRRDAMDLLYTALAYGARRLHLALLLTQNGRLRWYAGGIVTGAVVALALVVFR